MVASIQRFTYGYGRKLANAYVYKHCSRLTMFESKTESTGKYSDLSDNRAIVCMHERGC